MTFPSSFARSWLAIATGVLLALIGLVLLGGGVWLAWLGGSPYYLVTGAAMIVAGVLLVLGRPAGGWLYVAIFVCTVLWAFWEAGDDAWALVPRIFAPAVLLIPVICSLAALGRRAGRWRVAALSCAGTVVAVGALFAIVGTLDGAGRPGDLPAARMAMSDPSLQTAGKDWPQYGGSFAGHRYSPLTQITPANVGTLTRAWSVHTGDMPSDKAKGTYGAENTPLKIGDTLYVCTPKNIVIAYDPATGDQKWRFDPRVPDSAIPYTAACRGVSYYDANADGAGQAQGQPGVEDSGVVAANYAATPSETAKIVSAASRSSDPACTRRIVFGTLDARIFEIDADTGERCGDFGTNGEIDTTRGMGKVPAGYVSINSPPAIVDGVIVTGHQVTDGQDRWSPSGVIRGYDVRTGQLVWAWDMMHPDWTKAPPEGQTWSRGTPNMWTIASGDEKLGLVYLPMGNSSADYYSGLRTPVENEYATSLVALDVKTGKPRWHFQAVRNDVWDYDLGSQASLIDFPTKAGMVPAIVLPSKQGDIYVLDRRTGKPLTPVGKIRTPLGGVEPRMRARTQKVSLWHTLRKPPLTEKDMWGMSPIDQMVCRIQFREASYQGFYTPPTDKRRSIEYPGYNGGSDWGSLAIDPERGVIIANYNDMPNYVKLVPRKVADALGWEPRDQSNGPIGGAEGAGDPQANTPYAVDVNAGWRLPFTGMLCKEPPYGGIQAIDIATGKTIWDRPLGTARKNGPFGIASHLPLTIGTPNNGGAVITRSGLIFIAAATDDLIRAIDMKTGKTVWQDALPGGGQATPMIYEEHGKEYLVIYAGGHHFMETPVSDQVIAYALPG
ncbi:membrane-bound PQQ-dependent dehydrogenase, glucose/quinate/shikimate family [Novosphingobium sp. 1949]|uniref:Membrane-bound PQQ-dependent dehydrogenase, glucose/quinate/shikimate family n=1 Tax=Novosphingobium organovorum TaxID=2930092 RepID=A0ABT0BBI7_9SPHN|nr:membrane-bound PQQ-dependent dehydrogenase, glucose/quinate/shikimate family [Novosphingobium organovorum]MCJ2182176.1 membrane-bound PQQ-dependent dehydrogenase, glucose/quinate/shikimate family [Novosphingobium organovorum]